jgi:hypothetical protein
MNRDNRSVCKFPYPLLSGETLYEFLWGDVHDVLGRFSDDIRKAHNLFAQFIREGIKYPKGFDCEIRGRRFGGLRELFPGSGALAEPKSGVATLSPTRPLTGNVQFPKGLFTQLRPAPQFGGWWRISSMCPQSLA